MPGEMSWPLASRPVDTGNDRPKAMTKEHGDRATARQDYELGGVGGCCALRPRTWRLPKARDTGLKLPAVTRTRVRTLTIEVRPPKPNPWPSAAWNIVARLALRVGGRWILRRGLGPAHSTRGIR
jgi:hypothetical protein